MRVGARPGSRAVRARQRGAVALLVAFFLFVMFGVGAFVIDFGRWWVVRGELQNAADAAALAGTGYLFKPTLAGNPNWALATTQAGSAVSLNASEGESLSTGVVTPGYWNFSFNTFDTDTARSPAANDLPAVRVTITRSAAQNGGPMVTMLAQMIGTGSIDASASATAVLSVPKSAGEGALAPIALATCMVASSTGYWDATNHKPTLDPATGKPWVFEFGSGAASGKQCNGCECAQWTTFESSDNSASTLKTLIQNGNGSAVEVSDNTYIQPGTKATGYGEVDTYLKGKDVLVPIVASNKLDTKGFTPVLGYACMRILAGVQGGNVNKVCSEYPAGTPIPKGGGEKANKCIIARFSESPCAVGGSEGGGGSFTGAYVPPRLVR